MDDAALQVKAPFLRILYLRGGSRGVKERVLAAFFPP